MDNGKHRQPMVVVTGQINGTAASVMRDNGHTICMVKSSLVKRKQMMGVIRMVYACQWNSEIPQQRLNCITGKRAQPRFCVWKHQYKT